MSDRSKWIADRFGEAKEGQAINAAVNLQRNRVLDQGFDRISEELRRAMLAQCNELNAEPQIGNILVCDLSGDHSAITRSDTASVLSIEFDRFLHMITFKCDQPAKFRYSVEVKQAANGSWWYADAKGTSISSANTAGWLADKAICALLGIGD